MLERDLSGRDSLQIAVELELLELIMNSKIEAIIKQIYYSEFDQDGSLFNMSSNYNILFANKETIQDTESQFRFYKKRQIEGTAQSQWMYGVFKRSMNSRINANAILGFLYVAF